MAWVAALITAAGAAYGAYSSNQSANTMAGATGQAMNTTVSQGINNQLNLQPYQNAGNLGLGALLRGLGLGNPGANPNNPSNLPLNPRTGAPYDMSYFLNYDLSGNNNPASAQLSAQTQYAEYLGGNLAALGGPNGAVWGGQAPIMPGARAPGTAPTGAPGTNMGAGAATVGGQSINGPTGSNFSAGPAYPPSASPQSGGFGSLNAPFTMADFLNDPGYQFQLDQGEQAINAQAAARGNFYSPSTLMGLGTFATGLASQDYNTAFSQYWTQNQNRISNLMGLIGLGTGETNVGVQAGNSTTNALAGLTTSLGAINAAGQMGMANAISGGANSVVNTYLMNQILQKQNPYNPGGSQYNYYQNNYGTPYSGDPNTPPI